GVGRRRRGRHTCDPVLKRESAPPLAVMPTSTVLAGHVSSGAVTNGAQPVQLFAIHSVVSRALTASEPSPIRATSAQRTWIAVTTRSPAAPPPPSGRGASVVSKPAPIGSSFAAHARSGRSEPPTPPRLVVAVPLPIAPIGQATGVSMLGPSPDVSSLSIGDDRRQPASMMITPRTILPSVLKIPARRPKIAR